VPRHVRPSDHGEVAAPDDDRRRTNGEGVRTAGVGEGHDASARRACDGGRGKTNERPHCFEATISIRVGICFFVSEKDGTRSCGAASGLMDGRPCWTIIVKLLLPLSQKMMF
jgi:hypothetical protein